MIIVIIVILAIREAEVVAMLMVAEVKAIGGDHDAAREVAARACSMAERAGDEVRAHQAAELLAQLQPAL